MSKILVIYSPFPSMRTAKSAARILLKERMIACANIFESRSLYEWKGKLVDAPEFILVAKTTNKPAKEMKRLENRVKQLHPYELPAILLFSVSSNSDYAKWVSDSVG